MPIVPVDDQGAVLLLLGRVKPFQGQGQRIGTAVDVLFLPGDHVGILADSSPTVARLDLATEFGRYVGVEGLGVDDVAHLDQPGQVGAGAEPGIQAQDDRYRVGVTPIVGPQSSQVRFQFRAFSLQLVQPRPMACHCLFHLLPVLRNLGQLPPRRCQSATSLGQHAVRSFLATLGLVGGRQHGHLRLQLCHHQGQGVLLV